MGLRLKKDIATKLSKYLQQDLQGFAAGMEISQTQEQDYVIHIRSKDAPEITNSLTNVDIWAKIKERLPIQDVSESKSKFRKGIQLRIEPNYFAKSILNEIVSPTTVPRGTKRLIVEYSSPNIAKPFHVGHLRSTIIGQFIVNINKYCGEDATSLNYLGDWGTQFGLLQKGIDLLNKTDEEIKTNPIQFFYEAYVHANKRAETDSTILDEARQIFSKMEKGEGNNMERWKIMREVTVNYLQSIYRRLGVTFDQYNWESMYSLGDIQSVLQRLDDKNVTQTDIAGRKFAEINGEEVTIVKTDGSSLYLSRDIAAAFDRHEKHKFDEMYYVVDASQSKHFKSLFSLLERLQAPFAKQCKHIPFGRIVGMSSRKGTVVFLNDILDEAKDKMRQKRLQSPNTKGPIEDEEVEDILGISAVKINDMKQGRVANYNFDWDKTLRSEGDTGVSLQYAHCRLRNIELNCGVSLPDECVPELLTEKEAVCLIRHLSCFEETIESSKLHFEPQNLVRYLFQLCHHVNRANNTLRVKNESQDLAAQRLLLYHASRLTLNRGLQILGITPLNAM